MPAAERHTFPARHRIAKRREFLAIGHHGRRHDTRLLRAFVSQAADINAGARLGITVTKRVGNAVMRNRIKRHVREAFRTNTWPSGVDIVLIATAAAATATGAELARCVQTLAGRLAGQARPTGKQP
ncbi:MAG: ribonuclease P protein component [Myxococcales bacterium]|nr:ribonuclease P protein component [Myxococcales bacterium]